MRQILPLVIVCSQKSHIFSQKSHICSMTHSCVLLTCKLVVPPELAVPCEYTHLQNGLELRWKMYECGVEHIGLFWKTTITNGSTSKCWYYLSHRWMSHDKYTNESWNISEWVMEHIGLFLEKTITNGSTINLVLPLYKNASRNIYEWVMENIWMSHGTHIMSHATCMVLLGKNDHEW